MSDTKSKIIKITDEIYVDRNVSYRITDKAIHVTNNTSTQDFPFKVKFVELP